jgi:FtsP/CotA-like multicopper oxidase with cupredoxin domain
MAGFAVLDGKVVRHDEQTDIQEGVPRDRRGCGTGRTGDGDVIVDFGGLAGQDLVLNNLPLPAGVVSPAEPDLPNLMQFRVRGTATTPGPRTIPKTLAGGSMAMAGGPIARKRYITLEEQLDSEDNPIRLVINGRTFDEEPVDEEPRAGTVEEWWFVNISADTHPIHMHLTNFQVMGRTRIDGAHTRTPSRRLDRPERPYPTTP